MSRNYYDEIDKVVSSYEDQNTIMIKLLIGQPTASTGVGNGEKLQKNKCMN